MIQRKQRIKLSRNLGSSREEALEAEHCERIQLPPRFDDVQNRWVQSNSDHHPDSQLDDVTTEAWKLDLEFQRC